MLRLKCHIWLRDVTSCKPVSHSQLQLDSLVAIWKFGQEHGKTYGGCLVTITSECYLFIFFIH